MRMLPPLLLGLLVPGCGTTTTKRLHLPPLRTVPYVELEAILGRLLDHRSRSRL